MKRYFFSAAIMGLLLMCVQCSQAAPTCTYSLDSSKTQVGWTAFKTTAKVGVKGQFTRFTVDTPEKAESVTALLQGLKFKIDSTSVSTGNEQRDGVIASFFFQQMVGKPEITGGVEKITGKQSGTAQVRIFMNSESNLIPMSYKIDENNQITASGQLDIMNFGAGEALNSLHKACAEKHTGPDGVSKTWSEVELHISSQIKKDCSP